VQYPPTSDSSTVPAPPPGSVTGDESSQLSAPVPNFDGTQACYGADQRLFFPRKSGNAPAAVRAAKRYCAGCRFLTPCREWAVSQGRSTIGVWGGTTDSERRAIVAGRRELVAA
jgi:WhiB family redox-sensing transcriptional regulator